MRLALYAGNDAARVPMSIPKPSDPSMNSIRSVVVGWMKDMLYVWLRKNSDTERTSPPTARPSTLPRSETMPTSPITTFEIELLVAPRDRRRPNSRFLSLMLMDTSQATRISTDVPSSPERQNSYVAIPLG